MSAADTYYEKVVSKVFDSHRRQSFSLPLGIINYVTQNPISAMGLQKLQKTCKYFFAKNKIIVSDWKTNSFFQDDDNQHFFHFEDSKGKWVKFYFGDIKFWILQAVIFPHGIPNDRIYRCAVKKLMIHNQGMLFSCLRLFLNDGIKLLDLMHNSIIDDDYKKSPGIKMVSCDQILAKVPNIESFMYKNTYEIFTTETFEKMKSLKFYSKFDGVMINFYHFSPTINFLPFCKFIKKNAAQNTKFFFKLKMENSTDYFRDFQAKAKQELLRWLKKSKTTIYIITENGEAASIP